MVRWKNICTSIITVTQIFKDDGDVGTVVTRRMVTRGRDWCQQRTENLVPEHEEWLIVIRLLVLGRLIYY